MKRLMMAAIAGIMVIITGCASGRWQGGTTESFLGYRPDKKYRIKEIQFDLHLDNSVAYYEFYSFYGRLYSTDRAELCKGIMDALPEVFSEDGEPVSFVFEPREDELFDMGPLLLLTLGQFPAMSRCESEYQIFVTSKGERCAKGAKLKMKFEKFVAWFPSNLLILSWLKPARDDDTRDYSETISYTSGEGQEKVSKDIAAARYRALAKACLRAIELYEEHTEKREAQRESAGKTKSSKKSKAKTIQEPEPEEED